MVFSLISAIASICYPKQAITKQGDLIHCIYSSPYIHKYVSRDIIMTHSLL